MKIQLRYILLTLLLGCALEGAPLAAQWRADILSGYSQLTLPMQADYSGEVVATLVRRDRPVRSERALLYVHGYNDYFFQAALGDSIVAHGMDFYALDLRKYGRSILPHQDPFEVKILKEYYEELAAAVKQIRSEGAKEIYFMAHSTGGLITSLYLEDTKNSDSIRALILNSPFFDFNLSKAQEKILLPLVTSVAGLFPRIILLPPLKKPHIYDQSLLKQYYGRWEYDMSWKKALGHPVRLGWLRAIRRGHKRVQKGLHLQMPVLLMSSDKSLHSHGVWSEECAQADLVLDVEDIQRYGKRISSRVEAHRIPHGLHDLFLSSDTAAYQEAYRTLFSFINSISPSHP